MLLLIAGVAAASALTTAYHLARERASASARVRGTCEHPPEAQETMRVNNIITMNAALIHAVIPGRRLLTKHCLVCGEQVHMYRNTGPGHLQPFNEFMAEFDQETIDRAAQLQARTQAHVRDQAWAEELRKKKRAAG